MIRFEMMQERTKSGGTSLEGRDNRRKLLIKKWLYPPQYGRIFGDNTICDEFGLAALVILCKFCQLCIPADDFIHSHYVFRKDTSFI